MSVQGMNFPAQKKIVMDIKTKNNFRNNVLELVRMDLDKGFFFEYDEGFSLKQID